MLSNRQTLIFQIIVFHQIGIYAQASNEVDAAQITKLMNGLYGLPPRADERDPKSGKPFRSGSGRARSSFRVTVRACSFYAPAMAAFRRDRLSFGSDKFCRTENNFWRLWATASRLSSMAAPSRPRIRNCRNPRASFVLPLVALMRPRRFSQ